MKLFYVFFLTLVCTGFSRGQIIPSSCFAHDTILSQYAEDAQLLTLKQFYDNNYSYIDTIEIPTAYSDTMLNALIAVYNLSGVPSRDTVIDLLNIHALKQPSLNEFIILADSNLNWMQNLNAGLSLSGQPLLDAIITNYGFSLYSYTASNFQPYGYAHFNSMENYNVYPIRDTLESIPGVLGVSLNSIYGDGPTIYAEILPTHVELTYRYAWGDCPSGCTAERNWKFKVYYDCSVEFTGASGATLPQVAIQEPIYEQELVCFPNPFVESLEIKGALSELDYSIYDLNGTLMLNGVTSNNTLNASSLARGIYYLKLNSKYGAVIRKVVKL